MLQKTRYRRRLPHPLTQALELDLYARMLNHPLYPAFVAQQKKEQQLVIQETSSRLKKAA